MNESTRFAFAVALAIWGVVVASVLAVSFLDSLNTWQTLITGILALAAAVVTAILLSKQISQADNQERERLRRRFIAARSIMPLALSNICQYTQSTCDQFKNLYHHTDDNGIVTDSTYNPPRSPDTLVKDMERIIESTPNNNVCLILADILMEIQLLNTWSMGLTSEIVERTGRTNKENLNSYIYQCALIYALTNSLFDYARRESETISPINWENFQTSLFLLGIRQNEFPRIFESIQRAVDRGQMPHG